MITKRLRLLQFAALPALLILLVGGAVSAPAQQRSGAVQALAQASVPDKNVHCTATLIADTTAVGPGKKFKLGVKLLMDPGWHTYYKESGDAGMPTKITWQLPKGFKAAALEWEKPNKFVDAGITTYGYHDKTLIGATITPPADLKAGEKLTFSAKVKWLTCKDMCIPGGTDVSLTIGSAASGSPANAEAFGKLGFSSPVSQLTGETGDVAPALAVGEATEPRRSIIDADIKVIDSGNEKLSLPACLGLAFIGGFILNFMPCVLPVISIKVLSFMQQAGDDPKRVFKLGMTFTAGIISSFMALAAAVVAIQEAGAKIGWGFQFQFPLFLLCMSALVLLFALSLFGLFYIQVSAGQDQIDKLASKEGYTGTFFKGVLATTLSTPCSAPFLGTALGFAFSQPSWVVFLIFLTISIGMSFPYVLLTAQPAWMKYIPKPGVWMEKFKESMGFLLVATVVWLIWVLGKQVEFNACMAAVGFLVMLSFAAWVVGRFTDLTSTSQRKIIVYACAGAVLIGSYMVLLAPFPQLLSTSMPGSPPSNLATVSSVQPVGTASGSVSADEINWVPFSKAKLNEELEAGKTVFVDFTADWCLTCKINESTAINTAPVREKMRALNVVAMKADWTNQNPEISTMLQKFGRQAVPLYVIFPGSKPGSAFVLPDGQISADQVLQKLDAAGPSKS